MHTKLSMVLMLLAGTVLLTGAGSETFEGLKGGLVPEGSRAVSRQAILDAGIGEAYFDSNFVTVGGKSDCGVADCTGWTEAEVHWNHIIPVWDGQLGGWPNAVALQVLLVPGESGAPVANSVSPASHREINALPPSSILATLDACGPRSKDSDRIFYCDDSDDGAICVERSTQVGEDYKRAVVDIETGAGTCEGVDPSAEHTSGGSGSDSPATPSDGNGAGCSATGSGGATFFMVGFVAVSLLRRRKSRVLVGWSQR